MAKRSPTRPSFAEVVEAVKAAPQPVVLLKPGLHGDVFIDDDLRRYEVVTDGLSPVEARSVAAAGARLLWDSCACGGYCEVKRFSEEAVRAMARVGEPKVRHKRPLETISEMRAPDGSCILLVSGDVRWGAHLA